MAKSNGMGYASLEGQEDKPMADDIRYKVWKRVQAAAYARGKHYYTMLVDPRTDRVLATFTPGEEIAIARADREESRTRPAERDANARLIAKAPEMFCLLGSCLAYFDDMKNGPCAQAAPDAQWTAPIRALLWEIEHGHDPR